MTDCTFPDRPGTKHVTVESVLERLGLTHGRVGHEPSGDIEAARKALGYSRINLSGGSYGCAVAYTYCLRCPQTDVETLLVWAVRGDEAEPTGEQARYFRRGQVVLLKDMGHMDVGSLQPQATHHLEKRLFLEGAADASLYQSITEQSRDFVPRIAHTWPSGMTDERTQYPLLTDELLAELFSRILPETAALPCLIPSPLVPNCIPLSVATPVATRSAPIDSFLTPLTRSQHLKVPAIPLRCPPLALVRWPLDRRS